MFDRLHISKGKMTWMPGVDPFMVNSIVLDVSAADLTLNNSMIDGISSNYSSPVIYIENDPSASESHEMKLSNSRFTNNLANDTAGVLISVNTNVTIDNCTFENNTAL